MKEIKITANQENKRLDSFLKSYLSNASGSFIYKMLRKKNITLNDKKADGKEKLQVGDTIKIYFSDETLNKFVGQNKEKTSGFGSDTFKGLNVEVIYEDENVVFVNKPAGLLSQKAEKNDISLNDWLISYLMDKGEVSRESLLTYKPSICNRLDRNTSGLVICAKSLSGARAMNNMLKDRTLDKYYRTIVSGKVDKAIRLKGYLYKDESQNKVFIKNSDPKDERYSYIETEYVPLKYNEDLNFSLLEVKLITGKPHQIRAHLSSIGHPLVGDIKYGGKKFKNINYQILHSFCISFPADMSGELSYLAGKKFVAKQPGIFDMI
ncbi:MAG: RluA family pseudouridine synthase [Butyrivibrio sp.]|uniref:RluA family pseudouridine synthase n=1 Tax=Butyrivibrio sp. TaxID=28121 RepID=UPI001B03BD38|nr:RluA family pseudouridine synthase [Butyrivibrio sp.]MBO6242556.1 RluA family pseudouridine synthase [Butyrivibrio sp.]